MPTLSANYRILSLPVRVWWAGWETTTTKLQQAGWELSAEQDFHSMRLRLCIRHKDFQIYGVSQSVAVDYGHYNREDLVRNVVVPMQHVGSRLEVRIVGQGNPYANFKPIDAFPQITTEQIKRIEDLCLFATPLVRTQELIVNPDEIGKVLEAIQQAQLPEQAAIRERNRLRESREGMRYDAIPRQHFHAQIVSIAA